jgi:hypothetical protein
MSRAKGIRRAVALTALLGAVTLASPARGQGADQLRRRITLLETAHRQALATAARAESLAAERRDTIRAGRLTVFAAAGDRAVQRGAVAAWRMLDSIFGDATSPLAGYSLLVSRPARGEGTDITGRQGVLDRILLDSTAGVNDVTWQIVNAGSLRIQAQADSALKHWLGGAPLAEQAVVLSPRTRAYEEIVLAPWRSVHRCYLGELAWCRVALGLTQDSNPVVNWYDAAERRAIVAELRHYHQVWRQHGATERCLIQQSDEACIALLRSLPPTLPLPQPLPYATRVTLVRRAMELGGPGAYSRLAGNSDRALAARLAAAAGVSADSLLASWRRDILTAPPKTVRFAASAVWSAVGWVALVAFLGFRSTRWR